MRKKFKIGFTLIELLVVISIIAILAVMILINIEAANKQTRDAQRKKDLSAISAALDNYKATSKSYPLSSAAGCSSSGLSVAWAGYADNTCLASLISGGYIGTIPVDPVNVYPLEYVYLSNDGTQFKLVVGSEVLNSSYLLTHGNSGPSGAQDITNAKNAAGDYYNPAGDGLSGHLSTSAYTYFQVSSSATALNNW
jgi:general secretion pathway protein G